MSVLSAHQPELFPYQGFWQKARAADEFLLLTSYETIGPKRSTNYQSKQRIGGWDGRTQLRIPTDERMGRAPFTEVGILEDAVQEKLPWIEAHLLKIRQAYGWESDMPACTNDESARATLDRHRQLRTSIARDERERRKSAPHFERFFPAIESVYRAGHDSLADLNMGFIGVLSEAFSTPTVLSRSDGIDHDVSAFDSLEMRMNEEGVDAVRAELGDVIDYVAANGTLAMGREQAIERLYDDLRAGRNGLTTSSGAPKEHKMRATLKLVRLLQETGHDTYLSGSGAEGYVVDSLFEIAGKRNEYFSAKPVPYRQLHTDSFDPYLGGLDMLFTLGSLPEDA